jgi:DNA-binding IclR family transcriptional regulator
MKTSTQNDSETSASLEKALLLFNRVLHDRGRTALKQLAADLGLPRSTLYRLTATLQDFGLITRHTRGHYDIGLKLAACLEGITWVSQLARLSRPLLQRLADDCGSTAHLGVLEDGMVTYVVKVAGKASAAGAVFTRENAQLEAYCSGLGKVLLAWLPEAERETYLAAGPFVPLTSRTITDSENLRDCLLAARENGFAVDDGEVADNLFCLAVPVSGPELVRHAAISISLERASIHTRDRAVDLAKLRGCAAELSTRLGGIPAPAMPPPLSPPFPRE